VFFALVRRTLRLPSIPEPARREGQDGEAILTELGYGAHDIAEILQVTE
jgi:hypothetical protein